MHVRLTPNGEALAAGSRSWQAERDSQPPSPSLCQVAGPPITNSNPNEPTGIHLWFGHRPSSMMVQARLARGRA